MLFRSYIYDTNLLQQTSKYYKNVNLKLFEDSSYENLLETPPADMLVSMEYFLEQAGKTLEPLHCGISLKNFSPQQLPALYVPGDSGLFDSTMDEESFSSFFEGFDFSDEEENQGAKLYLNCTNSLVKRLHVLREPAFIETVIQVMYVQALLAGHYALGNKEMEMMNKGLIKLMEYGIGGMEP